MKKYRNETKLMLDLFFYFNFTYSGGGVRTHAVNETANTHARTDRRTTRTRDASGLTCCMGGCIK